jgi:hypothetical protein
VPKSATLWKLLGDGEIVKALKVKADAASAGARVKIEKAGGTVEVVAGDARARLEAGVARRAGQVKKRAIEVEAYKAEAVKAGKPKKTAPAKGAKAAKVAGAPKAAGAAKAAGAPKAAGGSKPPAPKKDKE